MSKKEQQNGEQAEDKAETIVPSTGPDRDKMAADYLPGSDEWLAKTTLDLNDPHAVAALRQFGKMFPEVDDLDPIIDEFTQDFLKGRTSVQGRSREEYNRIIESMFGGNPDDDGPNWGALVAGDLDD